MRKRFYTAVLVMVLLLFIAGACKSAPAQPLDESAIRVYADPVTETTLQGLSDNNIEKYTEHGNAEFKNAVTQKLFDQVASKIERQFGTYVSSEFLSAEEVKGYIVVHYRAHYTDGDVGVRMVFDQDHLLAGHFFE